MRPTIVEVRPAILHASQEWTENSRVDKLSTGYSSNSFRNLNPHIEDATRESRIPDNFLRIVNIGPAK